MEVPHGRSIGRAASAEAPRGRVQRLGSSDEDLRLAVENAQLRAELAALRCQVDGQRGTVQAPLRRPALVVFSGGTAFNSVAQELAQYTTRVTHVLPVSDDGGSTAEIVRIFGGPAVGDIRSRCLRLSDEATEEARAMKRLLHHRLPAGDQAAAAQEWAAIVEGRHPFWEGIGLPYRHTVRSFLVHFQVQILRHATESFNLCNGSVGNFFFAGARMWFRSLDAAIFMYCRVSGIPQETHVLPAICTEGAIALGCELENDDILIGQNAISHPPRAADCDARADPPMMASTKTLVDKSSVKALPSSVRRIFYAASGTCDGSAGRGLGFEELLPVANPAVLSALALADAVVFGMGSLFTSLCPSLVLDGVGEAVAALPPTAPRIFCLNGSTDRETAGLTASSCVAAAVSSLLRRGAPLSRGEGVWPQALAAIPVSKLVTHVLFPQGGSLALDKEALLAMGVQRVVSVASKPLKDGKGVGYDPVAFVETLQRILLEYAAAAVGHHA